HRGGGRLRHRRRRPGGQPPARHEPAVRDAQAGHRPQDRAVGGALTYSPRLAGGRRQPPASRGLYEESTSPEERALRIWRTARRPWNTTTTRVTWAASTGPTRPSAPASSAPRSAATS